MAQGLKKHGLLLVDTDVAFRDELSVALERFDVAIIWRARVKGLLEAVAETNPLAVVLSADLPGSEPIELLRQIRELVRPPELAVYVVGSALTRELVLQAYVEGADAVLTRDSAVAEIAARALGRTRVSKADQRPDTREEGRSVADAALDLWEANAAQATTQPAPEPAPQPTPEPTPESRAAPAPAGDNPFVFTDEPGSAAAIADALSAAPGESRIVAEPAPDPVPTAPPTAASVPATHPVAPPAPLGVPIGVSPPAVSPEASTGACESFGIRPATPVAVPDVIIVEDDPSLLEMLRYALTNRGYQTLSFSNGLDALRALREMDTASQKPVVLLDVDLPGIDGFRILHELSGSRPGAYQIILCTIHNSEATQVLGIQSGALDYLVKPLRMPIVLAKVEALIGRGSFNGAARGYGP